jgi:hypothetical protein
MGGIIDKTLIRYRHVFKFFIRFGVHIQLFFSQCVDCAFKSTRKLDRDISGSLDKAKIS